MVIFVTPRNEDDRFVIYLKTSVCKVIFNSQDGLYFEGPISKLVTMKDFFINFGVQQLEIREYKDNTGALVLHDQMYMQLDDTDNIRGIRVPILTVL